MIAIIKTGGKQYIVKPGDKLKVEKLDKKEGEEIVFSDVLLVAENYPAGKGKIEIGNPLVKAEVTAKVLKHGKGDKIIVFKYKPKKREAKKTGHRQPYTEIEIIGIK